MAQHARPVGPTTNLQATFEPSMVQGCLPQRSRSLLGARIPLPVSQTTHVSATFGPEMAQGYAPARNREYLPLRTGLSVSQTTPVSVFSVEMGIGAKPERARPHDVARPLRAGWQAAQTTHVAAAFAPDMVSDTRPHRHRQLLPPRCDYDVIPPDVPAFSVEMFVGSKPEKPRILLGARIPLPVSQTTQVDAPFQPTMAQGQKPDRNRELLPTRPGWTSSQTTPTAAPFSPEMAKGHTPTPQPVGQGHKGAALLPPDVLSFSVEMVQGSRPEKPRLFLAPRIPLPLAQSTPVAAPFSVDMAQGSRPERLRARRQPTTGWMESQVTFLSVMTPEMFAGVSSARPWFTRATPHRLPDYASVAAWVDVTSLPFPAALITAIIGTAVYTQALTGTVDTRMALTGTSITGEALTGTSQITDTLIGTSFTVPTITGREP